VFDFGLVANLLDHVLAEIFALAFTQYVDDFPQIEAAASCDSARVAEQVLALLGWEVKLVDNEIPDFMPEFTALGVIFDMSDAFHDNLLIKDKPGRVAKIDVMIDNIIQQGTTKKEELTSLRGLVGYTRSQCFGRCGALTLHALSCMLGAPERKLTTDDELQLQFWQTYFAHAEPRKIKTNDFGMPVLIFVDGAEETSGVGIGAVIVDGAFREGFGGKVPNRMVEEWRRDGGREKVIHQAELLPAAVAAALWEERLWRRRWVLFVDNDGARGALVKGSTAARPSARIVQRFWVEVGRQASFPWVDRVPTHSNLADGPSRGDWSVAGGLGVKEVKIDWSGRM